MKAWRVHQYGDFEQVLQLEKTSQPLFDADSYVIKVDAAGVNFADILSIAGKYQVKSPLPFTPGYEAVGTVVKSGENCDLEPGTRVVGFGFAGAFAEYMKIDKHFAFVTPAWIPNADAAGLVVTYHTSWFALALRAQLVKGEVLLVHGGAGGVGTTAIQLGKAMGATVIATAGSDEKLEVCRKCGADYTINYRTQDFVQEVKKLTDGRGADVIFEQIGGEVFEKSTRCIAFEGRILIIGFTSGTIPTIATNRILLKNIAIIGLNWPNYQFNKPKTLQRAQQDLYRYYQKGLIKPRIDRVAPLEALPQALRDIQDRKVNGKIILKP